MAVRERNIDTVEVNLVKDKSMEEPVLDNSLKEHLPCSARFVGFTNIRRTSEQDACFGRYEAGTETSVATSNTIAVAKMHVDKRGFVYIPQADYDTFRNGCSSCCD